MVQRPSTHSGALKNILRNILSVKSEQISKVVDENGEPLVVYHGTENGGHSSFNAKNYARSEPVTCFADKKEVAFEYVRNYEIETFSEENGSQIATDNIGTFDEDNDDIYFSVVQDEKLLGELEKGFYTLFIS